MLNLQLSFSCEISEEEGIWTSSKCYFPSRCSTCCDPPNTESAEIYLPLSVLQERFVPSACADIAELSLALYPFWFWHPAFLKSLLWNLLWKPGKPLEGRAKWCQQVVPVCTLQVRSENFPILAVRMCIWAQMEGSSIVASFSQQCP